VSVRTLRSEPVNQTVGALNADSFKTANATYGFQIWHTCFQRHSIRYHLIFFRTSGCGQGHVTYDGDMDSHDLFLLLSFTLHQIAEDVCLALICTNWTLSVKL